MDLDLPPQICQRELRDPMTSVMAFTPNPGPLRQSCRFFVEVYDHCVYLEGGLSCPFVTATEPGVGSYAPVQISQVPDLRTRKTNALKLHFMHLEENVAERFTSWAMRISRDVDVVLVQAAPIRWLRGLSLQLSTGLTSVVLEDLPQLTKIDMSFAQGCPLLQRARLVNLPKLTIIQQHLLHNCPELADVTIEQLPSLEQVGYDFLSHCKSLRRMRFGGFPLLALVQQHFLDSCQSLSEVEFDELPGLQAIGFRWMRGAALKTFTITGRQLPMIYKIEQEMLADCRQLTHVCLEDLPCLRALGQKFCIGSSVQSVRLARLPALEEISPYFCQGCDELKLVQFENLPVLKLIKPNCFHACTRITTFRLGGLPELTRIESGFLKGCATLQEVELFDLPLLSSIDPTCMTECPNLKALRAEPKLSALANWV